MANDEEYRPTPISAPNGLMPFVNPQTGVLTEHGLQMLQEWREYFVGMNRVIPCTATGKNLITLTPNRAHPVIKRYFNHDIFVFVAAQSSDGSVTATVVPDKGVLATIKVYKTGGSAQAGSGDIVANSLYLAAFADHLDSGNGGLVLK